jgi:alpha-beta hydrolase superfamily lysophospholipase
VTHVLGNISCSSLIFDLVPVPRLGADFGLNAELDRALAALRAPVLALYASADDVIAPNLSVEAALAALSDHPDALVIAVPGMTHELTRAAPQANPGAAPEDGTMPV